MAMIAEAARTINAFRIRGVLSGEQTDTRAAARRNAMRHRGHHTAESAAKDDHPALGQQRAHPVGALYLKIRCVRRAAYPDRYGGSPDGHAAEPSRFTSGSVLCG